MSDAEAAVLYTSGQSFEYGSAGSGPSACPICGRVHQGPCHLSPRACFRCGQVGHFAIACPYSGYQQAYSQGSSSSIAQSSQQPQFYPQQSGAQFGGHRGRGSGGRLAGRPSGRGFAHPSTSQQTGHGQARVFTLTPQDAQASNAVVAGTLSLCFCEAHVLFVPGASHSLFRLVLLLN